MLKTFFLYHRYIYIYEVDIKRVGLFNKQTSDKSVIVNYIKFILTTNTEIAYVGRTRRSLNATVQLFDRYSTNYLTICVATMTLLESTFVYLYRQV